MKKIIPITSIYFLLMCLSSFAQTVTIGTQVWMTKNLDVSTFRNGDPIPQAKTNEEWKKAGLNKQPAWCYYDNDPANGAKYGKLYNWYAVNDPRGLAPTGYHIPSDAEWTTLENFLDVVVGKKMKSTNGWIDQGKLPFIHQGNGTNSSGFNGLPGGSRGYKGSFSDIGCNGYWWSSTELNTYNAWYRGLFYFYDSVYRNFFYKLDGFSVRCLKD